MDTPENQPAKPDYAGLKNELQNIAGIVEQYPDHLKQRAFELLISSYLGSGQAKENTAALAAEVSASVGEESPAGTSQTAESDFVISSPEQEAFTSETDTETPVNTSNETSTNQLRRRIRLRTMTPMRWRAPV